jgi:hypothetical protein
MATDKLVTVSKAQQAAVTAAVKTKIKSDGLDVWPGRYPNSVALCVIDSIQSLGVRYGGVKNVIASYRQHRTGTGASAARDGLTQLLATFDEVGGHEEWAGKIGNGQRTYSRRTAPRKSEAIQAAAKALQAVGIETTADLRKAAKSPELLAVVGAAWRGAPGQRSGISWWYLLMLAGVPGVKPDRMIKRFVAKALGTTEFKIGDGFAIDIVTAAAAAIDSDPTTLDHAIWGWQGKERTRA